jgi:hypothetical protein
MWKLYNHSSIYFLIDKQYLWERSENFLFPEILELYPGTGEFINCLLLKVLKVVSYYHVRQGCSREARLKFWTLPTVHSGWGLPSPIDGSQFFTESNKTQQASGFLTTECSFNKANRPDDAGSKHLWNVCQLLRDYTAQYPRRLSSSYSPPLEPEISLQIWITLFKLVRRKSLMWRRRYKKVRFIKESHLSGQVGSWLTSGGQYYAPWPTRASKALS